MAKVTQKMTEGRSGHNPRGERASVVILSAMTSLGLGVIVGLVTLLTGIIAVFAGMTARWSRQEQHEEIGSFVSDMNERVGNTMETSKVVLDTAKSVAETAKTTIDAARAEIGRIKGVTDTVSDIERRVSTLNGQVAKFELPEEIKGEIRSEIDKRFVDFVDAPNLRKEWENNDKKIAEELSEEIRKLKERLDKIERSRTEGG